MKKFIVFALGILLFASCSSGIVVEYTIVKEGTKNGETYKDTIKGNTISYSYGTNYDICSLVYNGNSYAIKGNWNQDIGGGEYQVLSIEQEEKVTYFNWEPVEYCKIGFFKRKVYPKETRDKYSKILCNL